MLEMERTSFFKSINLISNYFNFYDDETSDFCDFGIFDFERTNENDEIKNSTFKVLFNGLYLVTMIILVVFFFPFFVIICINIV